MAVDSVGVTIQTYNDLVSVHVGKEVDIVCIPDDFLQIAHSRPRASNISDTVTHSKLRTILMSIWFSSESRIAVLINCLTAFWRLGMRMYTVFRAFHSKIEAAVTGLSGNAQCSASTQFCSVSPSQSCLGNFFSYMTFPIIQFPRFMIRNPCRTASRYVFAAPPQS